MRDKITKLILVLTIFVVVISATFFVIKYQTEVFLSDLQTNLSTEFQHPVFIENVDFKWVGMDIHINIDNFIVRDNTTDAPMLMFGNMNGVLSPLGSILRLHLRFKELVITNLKMKLGIKGYNDIRLLGLLGQPLTGSVDATPILDLIFGQQKLIINDTDIILTGYEQDIHVNYSNISINDIDGKSVFKMLGTINNNPESKYIVSGSYIDKTNINFDAQFNKVAFEQLRIFFPKNFPSITGKINSATISGSTYHQELQNLNLMFNLDNILLAQKFCLDNGKIQFIYNRQNSSGRLFVNDFKFYTSDNVVRILEVSSVLADFVIKDDEISTANLQAKINDFDTLIKFQVNENKPKNMNVTLFADFEHLNVEDVKQWLDLKLISPAVLTWINNSLKGGNITHFYAQIDEKNQILQADFNNVELMYSANWPKIDNLNTTLTYNNGKILLENSSGKMFNIPIFASQAYFQENEDKKFAHLIIQGNAQTHIENTIEYLKQTPLQKEIMDKLEPFKPSGKLNLDLNLDLNLLDKIPKVTFNGIMQVFDGKINLYQVPLEVDNIVGSFKFNNTSVQSDDLSFNLLGNLASSKVFFDSNVNELINLDLSTNIEVASIASLLKNVNLDKIKGQTYLNAHIEVPYNNKNSAIELTIKSSLVGIESNYPAPFNKIASEELNTIVTYKTFAGKLGKITTNIRNYDFAYDFDSHKLDFAHETIKGSFISEPKVNKYNIILDYINCDKIFSSHTSASKSDFNLNSFKKLDKPVIVQASLKKIIYNNYALENVSFHLLPRNYGYQIVDLHINNNDLHLQAEGQWQLKSHEFTQLSGNAYSEDFGNLLNKLGKSSSISKSNGEINFSLTVPGDLTNVKKNNLEGVVKVNFNDGVINSVEPGFGRILGLISFEGIMRRLQLDFSDLTDKGLAFDSLSAEYHIHQNIISTKNINIQAPSAQIELSGKIDIDTKDIDLSMLIIPHVGSSIPVAAAIATGNPAIGAVLWLVDKASGSQIMDFAQLKYTIGGTLDKPIIKDAGTK